MRLTFCLLISFLCLSIPVNGTTDETGQIPRTQVAFDTDPDKFTFAIHADLTGGERPAVFETAMAQLELLRPDFVINVGDLIDGGMDRRDLIRQWESYDARVDGASFPVFYVGGNHDVSNTVEREVWKERLGPTYYSFRYRDVLFLVLDSEDMTEARREELVQLRLEALKIHLKEGAEAALATPYGQSQEKETGAIGDAQVDHFIEVIEANPDVRHTFLFVHKPVWEAAESPYFRLEAALEGHPYTAFNGHVHAYGYTQRNGQDHVQLATTGGAFFPHLGLSADHVTLVAVDGSATVHIANLMLDGIRDKTGEIPLNGGRLCLSSSCERN